ncbi:MAG: sodium/solute symporter [Pirellulales bacterium]|nr:sodium/solute symporter [Pirellulales bacterium]
MNISFLDLIVLVAYFFILLGIGYYFMARQRNTTDYFLGGRKTPWFAAAISLFCSLFSAVSFIAAPGYAYTSGMPLYLSYPLFLLALPPAIVLFVRFYRRLELTSAYEYLERRFDVSVRAIASFLFLVLRCFYLGVVLYASALALAPLTGLNIWSGILIMGIVATATAGMGGMSSVIWADVFQFIVLLGGVLLVLGLLMADAGGLGEIWAFAGRHDRTFGILGKSEFYSFNPFVEVTLFPIIFSALFTKLSYSGADQVNIQRYLSTRGEKEAVQSLIWGTVVGMPVLLLLFLLGLGLFYFYQKHPELAKPEMTGDQVLPHFIAHQMPPGTGGLLIAAILAASLGALIAVINSLATCSITDFYVRLLRPLASESQKLRLAKRLTVFWGVMGMVSAGIIIWLFGANEGRNSLLKISQVTIGFFGGILLGVFLLGILTRRTTTLGVWVGVGCGLTIALAVTAPYYFFDRPEGEPQLSFLWINIIGCIVTIVAGYAASFFGPPPDRKKIAGMTYWDQQ